ncbi:DUF4258 domain-containing protein [Pyrodictium abyssi]|uniref:DUF4258 domain-containing protein n=1 Tax=Pyrodictium abyssi TaxID=54256 RepID=A0ABM8J0D6_9CREN|nr:hypothetical protein PABY_17610 [Pyrodictium abyssi]
MKIRCTFHAIERMRQRGIKREEVEDCLDDPDRILEVEELKCVKRLNGKVLVVVYRKDADAVVVITAFRSSKLHRYLQTAL